MKPKIALVGTPNAGKTALFNVLTHSHQRVANYSGVTVESAEADLFLPGGTNATLTDLPGAYSLRPYTEDESVLAEALKQDTFQGVVLVVDATQPERAIRFLIEVLDSTEGPAVVALNMADLAEKRGFQYDLVQMTALLGVPVISTSALERRGLAELQGALVAALRNQKRERGAFLGPKRENLSPAEVSEQILSFYKKADEFLKTVLIRKGNPDDRSRRMDAVVLHPVFGPLILVLVLGLVFQLMFNLAQAPMDWIESAFDSLRQGVNALPWNSVFKHFIADGVLAGVGGTLVFLPQIIILYALILFLEDFGFMARAVFMLDHLMGKVGLHGRSFLPLLSSYACNVPGVLATRTIESRSDRILTLFMIPLTTCSARIPVYTLLISAFIPNQVVFGSLRLQGVVMLGLYAVGILSALFMGAVLKRLFFRGHRPPLLIELPSYKRPSIRSLFRGMVYRVRLFLKRVGTVILTLTVLIWILLNFPAGAGVEGSYAAGIGHFIEPWVRPLGFDWRIAMALIPTFAAREVMVGTLATVYAVQGGVSDLAGLSGLLHDQWPLATGIALLVWFIYAPMCISTLAALRRELKSPVLFGGLVTVLMLLSYLASWVAHQAFL